MKSPDVTSDHVDKWETSERDGNITATSVAVRVSARGPREVDVGPREGTDFGQSRFGHLDLTNFGQNPIVVLARPMGQNQFWANPFLANPFLANPFLDLVCVMAPKGEAQTQKKSGPEGWGPEGWGPEGGPEGWGPEGWGPKISRFFPSPATNFALFCLSLCVLSWFFGGVGSAGAVKCARLEFSGCRVKPGGPDCRWGLVTRGARGARHMGA